MKSANRHIRMLLVATSMAALAAPASAAIITFDDLGTDSFAAIPTEYQGFTWDFWASINGPNYGTSGYANGVVSPGNVACGCAGDFGLTTQSIYRASGFTLNSGYFTSAWNDGATLVVTGLNGATELFSTSAVLNTTGPSLLTFNWSGIDRVTFSISGGTQSELPGSGDYFALDNLSVDLATGVVPEPASWAMLIAGFGLVGATMRRRRAVLAA